MPNPSIRGGGGSGEKAFVRGVVGESTYGFNRVIQAGFLTMLCGVMGILWP
jgi:hypothetical protein